MMLHLAAFAATFAALFAAHQVADHWVQTEHQAMHKGDAGWYGRLTCARHVATYTALAAVALGVLGWRVGLPLPVGQVALGLAVSAVTHYWADRAAGRRKVTLWRLAKVLRKEGFYFLGDRGAAPCGTGDYASDQSWHIGWLFVAALIIA